jgi:hypothetical protein
MRCLRFSPGEPIGATQRLRRLLQQGHRSTNGAWKGLRRLAAIDGLNRYKTEETRASQLRE